MKKRPIIVCLSTDENQIYHVGTVIHSIMMYSLAIDFYRFYILVPKTAESLTKDILRQIEEICSNCEINVIAADDYLPEVEITIPHITKPTFYRLFLPDIILEERCIYLDTDILVCESLAQLFEEEMDGALVAGVLAAGWHINSNRKKETADLLDIPSGDDYINAGVLLMDLEGLRHFNFCEKINTAMKKTYPTQDQDLINKVLFGHIKILPIKYNVMTKYLKMEKALIEDIYGSKELEEGIRNPVIIHYANPRKPWEFYEDIWADRWWNNCKKTIFVSDLSRKYQDTHEYLRRINKELFLDYRPYSKEWVERLRQLDNKYIYGAGNVAESFGEYFLRNQIDIEAALVSDIDINKKTVSGQIPVILFSDKIEKTSIIIIAMGDVKGLILWRQLREIGYINVCLLDAPNV